MRPGHRQSQKEFEERLRRNVSNVDEIQQRVWERIQNMTEEERMEMAARIPDSVLESERDDSLPDNVLPISEKKHKKHSKRLLRLAMAAAAFVICVLGMGMRSIGNKYHEYQPVESGVYANNTDVLQVPLNINSEIQKHVTMLGMRAIRLDFWPEELEIVRSVFFEEDGRAIIGSRCENEVIYMYIDKPVMDQSFGISNNSVLIEYKQLEGTDRGIDVYEVEEQDGVKTYLCVVFLDGGCYCIRGFHEYEMLHEIVENISIVE